MQGPGIAGGHLHRDRSSLRFRRSLRLGDLGLGPVEQPAATEAEGETFAVDQVVEHLGGDGRVAAVAGSILAGGQRVGSVAGDDPAIVVAMNLGNGRLGACDRGLELAELGLVVDGLLVELLLERRGLGGESLDIGLEPGDLGGLGLDLLERREDVLLDLCLARNFPNWKNGRRDRDRRQQIYSGT